MKRTRKIILYSLAILSAMLLVSTVTAVPLADYLKCEDRVNKYTDEIIERLQNVVNSKRFKMLKNIGLKNIPVEKYSKISEEVESTLKAIPGADTLDDSILQLLIDILLAIASAIYLLLGHNLLGDFVVVIASVTILFIPVLIMSLGLSVALSIATFEELLMEFLGVTDFAQLIYDFGIVGFGVFMMLLMPIALLFFCVAIPFWAGAVFGCTMIEILLLLTQW